jgi:phage gpG-like protein
VRVGYIITLSEEAKRVLQKLENLPERTLQAIASAIDLENSYTIKHIQEHRMNAPFDRPPLPPSMGIMRHISGNLKARMWARKSVITNRGVESSIGNNIKYAGIHEFGGTINRRVSPGLVRLRTTATGELVRGSKGGAVFAKKTHSRVREVAFTGGTEYTVNIPARRPIQRGIEDRMKDYEEAILKSIVEAAIPK